MVYNVLQKTVPKSGHSDKTSDMNKGGSRICWWGYNSHAGSKQLLTFICSQLVVLEECISNSLKLFSG